MPVPAHLAPTWSSDACGLRVLNRSYRICCTDSALLSGLALLYAPMLGDVAPDATDLFVTRLPDHGLALELQGERFEFSDPWVAQAPASALTHVLLATETRHLVFHAGAFERNGRSVILAGASGMGKSTLVAHLGVRGARILSDEFAPVLRGRGCLTRFPLRLGLREGPRPDRPGLDADLPGERKRLYDPDAVGSVPSEEPFVTAVVILGTESGTATVTGRSRARMWFDAPPEVVEARLVERGFRVVERARLDGLWVVVAAELPEIRQAVDGLKAERSTACPLLRVQFEDLDPPDFHVAPVLREASPTAGVLELSKRLSTAQRSRIVDREFSGDATRLIMETAASLQNARFLHLRPGRLNETLDLLEGLLA